MNVTAILYIVIITVLVLSALYLRFCRRKATAIPHYRVPFGKIGIIVAGGTCLLSCGAMFFVSFIPGTTVGIKNIFVYETSLTILLLLFFGLPVFIYGKLERASKEVTLE